MTRAPLTILRKLAPLAVMAAMVAGCGSDDGGIMGVNNNGGEEQPPPVEIKTPKYVVIEKITVTRFSAKKSNGDNWDWDPFSSDPRRPDIRVALQRSGAIPAYSSDTRKNARSTSSHAFTKPASIYDGHLPHKFSYGTTYKIHLVDDDFGGDETMHSATVKGSSLYKKDNAATFTRTIYGDRDFRVKVQGHFQY